jgi:hypothetical protein
MADLTIRAAMNDHLVVENLLVPSSVPRLHGARAPIDRLVADAHVARARPMLAELASGAGVPYLVDPETPFLQVEVAGDDPWAKLPYATAERLSPGTVAVHDLVAKAVEFQLEMGATTIIPPYFYASSPTDPWFLLSLHALDETAEYLRQNDVRLPVQPVLCAQLRSFGTHLAWPAGVDRFVERAKDSGASALALYFSPAGKGKDSYGKVRGLFDVSRHVKDSQIRTVAWRQGVYGAALVAAGLDGYECGMGTAEQSDVSARQSARKPKPDERRSGGGAPGIFLEPLGRSVPRAAGLALLGDLSMRPKVMCDGGEVCCSSPKVTIDRPREHAVRSRARFLATIAEQPATRWRLHHIAQEAKAAVTLATQANRVLDRVNTTKTRIGVQGLDALARVAAELSESAGHGRTA